MNIEKNHMNTQLLNFSVNHNSLRTISPDVSHLKTFQNVHLAEWHLDKKSSGSLAKIIHLIWRHTLQQNFWQFRSISFKEMMGTEDMDIESSCRKPLSRLRVWRERSWQLLRAGLIIPRRIRSVGTASRIQLTLMVPTREHKLVACPSSTFLFLMKFHSDVIWTLRIPSCPVLQNPP